MDMTKEVLSDFLDTLPIGRFSRITMRGNSRVYSLATFNSHQNVLIQTATVSFHQEPELFKACTTDNPVDCHFQTFNHERKSWIHHRVTIDCDFYGTTPLYQPPGSAPPEYEYVRKMNILCIKIIIFL
jgi:hypothetical protein